MHICRFCLTEKDPLSNIYERDNKNATPLPLQIMACVAIEVFANDGMPQMICDDCRSQTGKSYLFKTICKRSDDALKLYLATGVLNKYGKEEALQPPKLTKKRSVEADTQASPEKRSKSNGNTVKAEPVQDNNNIIVQAIENAIQYIEQPLSTVEPADDVTTVLCDEPEINDVDIKLSPTNSPPKQVITHCFSCEHCERSFPLQQLLDIHMRQHTRERKFACFQCGKRFFSKHDLSKHSQTHSGEKPYTCVVCDKSFSRATLLHRHEKVHVSVPKYLCTYCDKTYLSSEDLDAHMLIHKKKRPYKCEQCDKSFAFKQGLERHEAVHNPENPYKCNYCDESFTTAGKLARHVTSHAGARPFPCKLCPRTFLLSHHLSRHLRNHYSRKVAHNECGEHKCDVCSMSFRRKDSLVNHTAIHSMVNLKCLICNKEFSDARTVKEHVTTHLSGLPYPCDKCDYSFETQEELEEHEVKHGDLDDYDDEFTQHEMRAAQVQEAQVDTSTPLVRRSQRESKIKNYADFLKDELGSDSDENIDEPEDVKPVNKIQIGTIQPVIRSDTIKVYKGVKDKCTVVDKGTPTTKTLPASSEPPEKITNEPIEQESSAKLAEPAPKSVTKIMTLENLGLSKQALDAMTEKSGFVEMKVGQKVIRVQKLMMTKAEYQAMAKQGKLEMKGSTIVVQNKGTGGLDLNRLTQAGKNVVKDPLTDTPEVSEHKVTVHPGVDIQVSKTPVRTYVKRFVKTKEEQADTDSCGVREPSQDPVVSIDLAPNTMQNIQQTDTLTSIF